MRQPDLFDYQPPVYPNTPGYKEKHGTSKEAAEAIAGRAGVLRRMVYDYIRSHPCRTADEIAAALREDVLTIRPRVSELRLKGLIVNDGRGKNRSGKAAHRWRAVPTTMTSIT